MEQIVRPFTLHLSLTIEKCFALLNFTSSSVLATSVDVTPNLKPIMAFGCLPNVRNCNKKPRPNSCNMDLRM